MKKLFKQKAELAPFFLLYKERNFQVGASFDYSIIFSDYNMDLLVLYRF